MKSVQSISVQSIKSYNGSIKVSSHNNSSFYPEADRNVTELTLANSGLDLEQYLNQDSKIEDGKSSPTHDSDSGISDQSPNKAEQVLDQQIFLPRSRHESSAYASSTEDEAMLQVHRFEDGTLVLGTSPSRSSPPAVKISPSASLKRQARLEAMADELTVLSAEDVVDTAIKTKAKPDIGCVIKEGKIPPRAMVGQPGYDEDAAEETQQRLLLYG